MEKSTEQILAALRELAAALGTTVEHLWPVLIKQQFLWAVSDVVVCVVFILSGWLLARHCWSHPWMRHDGDPTGYGVIGGFGLVLSGATAFARFSIPNTGRCAR